VQGGQRLALVAVAIAVLGLFGYMVANSGRDHDRERELAAQAEEAPALLDAQQPEPTTSTTAPTTTTAAPATTAAPLPRPDEPVDEAAFCGAAGPITAYELRIMAAFVGGEADYASARADLIDDRGRWAESVAAMRTAGPPELVNDIDAYQRLYDPFLDAIAASPSLPDLLGRIDAEALSRSSSLGVPINQAIQRACS
jgi:hypothetical protein